jgi:NTE family protein
MTNAPPGVPGLTTGLVLTGGGARAAYQVGVLRAIGRIRRDCDIRRGCPFQVITGTSAGAINATALAANADHFDGAITGLSDIWQGFSADQVYRADALGVIRTGARWLTMLTIGWAIARWRRARPRSLLDNDPLADLLTRVIPLQRLPELMRDGHLRALAVTASSYSSGEHVTFYQTADSVSPWLRSQRLAMPSQITVPHLMASSAIPFVFPAVKLMMNYADGSAGGEWFGDGSMRQSAPISAAVHLGSQRIMVVGAGRLNEPAGERRVGGDYPSLAQIAGHAMSNIFLDALAVDVERLQRINATLSLLTQDARAQTPLRPIEVFVIAPSQRLDDMAERHIGCLPTPVRAMLRGVGVSSEAGDTRGAALASYLLFESPYTRELIDLGEADTMARRDELAAFFGWDRRHREAVDSLQRRRVGEHAVAVPRGGDD